MCSSQRSFRSSTGVLRTLPTSGLFAVVLALAAAICPSSLQADLIVVSSNDDLLARGPACTLRDAIEAANSDSATGGCDAGNGDDRIEFAVGGSTIGLTADLPLITESLEIVGPGRSELEVTGNGNYKVFEIDNNVPRFELSGLTIAGGATATNGGCLDSRALELLVEDVRFVQCSADVWGGVFVGGGGSATIRRVGFAEGDAPFGGGLYTANVEVELSDCLFFDNTADEGGAVAVGGAANFSMKRCTLTDNSAGTGSAILVYFSNAAASVSHATISANHSTGADLARGGAVERTAGELTIFNSIIAGNFDDSVARDRPDVNDTAGIGTWTSNGFNLIGSNEGASTVFSSGQPNANGDLVGTALAPIDPVLADLAQNGGPTRTMRVKDGSPLIDAGSCPGELTDQRGFANSITDLRPVDDAFVTDAQDGCDIGAFERGASEPPLFADGFETGDTTAWM